MQLTQEDTMNQTQSEQLFTDLTLGQAETIAAGVVWSDPYDSWGYARTNITRQGPGKGLFYVDAFVKDFEKNGYPVYVKFQGLATDNDVLTNSQKLWDKKGADGAGSSYNHVRIGFNKNIKKVRAVIYQDDPGSDSAAYEDWAAI